jgi:hypothetical protein
MGTLELHVRLFRGLHFLDCSLYQSVGGGGGVGLSRQGPGEEPEPGT